jgi:hypothetical protein
MGALAHQPTSGRKIDRRQRPPFHSIVACGVVRRPWGSLLFISTTTTTITRSQSDSQQATGEAAAEKEVGVEIAGEEGEAGTCTCTWWLVVEALIG